MSARPTLLTARVLPWLEARRRHHGVASPRNRPFVLGINGPQGGGKSTLATQLVDHLTARGCRALAVSIDDFYLTHAEQRALAVAHPDNRYLEHRGYPGTHDIALGAEVLSALCGLTPGLARVPRYDKSANAGRGDRASEAEWATVRVPLDVLIVEGWMLGFRPASPAALAAFGDVELHAPNAALAQYEAWTTYVDDAVVLRAEAPEHIVAWRVDSERARRSSGAAALSDADARDYIERFLPAYALWGRSAFCDEDVPGAVLRVTLDPGRSPM